MKATAEQHFEGLDDGALRRRRRLIGVGIAVVLVLLVLFAKSTLPGPRGEFVGNWQAGIPSKTYLDIRPDGSYSARMPFLWGSSGSWFLSQGVWRASHNALYLTPKSMKPDGVLSDMRGFKQFRDAQLNKEQRLRINWNDPNSIFAEELDSQLLTRLGSH